MARRERATFDDGWVGKHIHGFGPDEREPVPRAPEVAGTEDRVLFYIVEDGIVCRYTTPNRCGFVW